MAKPVDGFEIQGLTVVVAWAPTGVEPPVACALKDGLNSVGLYTSPASY